MKAILVAALAVISSGCAGQQLVVGTRKVSTVSSVDLNRYLGTWYEVAAIPQPFQKSCQSPSATYALREDGQLSVLSRCRKDSLEGDEQLTEGVARIVDRSSNAKLEVSFNGPFWGQYWIIDLGPEYEFAVIGQPNRQALTVLSRSPHLSDPTFAAILTRALEQGYDISQVRRVEQAPQAAHAAR
jgi:apolipoprotein D and lipocalin family protein